VNIVCRINSKARWAQLFEGMRVCWNLSVFGGGDYNRFVVAFDCGMPVLSSLVLNGDKLQRAIGANETLSKCASGIIESSLLWYDASSLQRKLYGWKCLLPIQWQITKREVIHGWRDSGWKVLSSRYTILETLNKSTRSIRQVEGHVILLERGTVPDKLLWDIVRHAVSRLRRCKIRKTDQYGEKGRAGRPDYIRVRLYTEQRRLRTLMSYSWLDKELLLIAEWISSAKKVDPFYTEKADAVLGHIRIKYNPGNAQTPDPGNAP